MNDDIRTVLQRAAEAVPPMGEASSAYTSGRRRRAAALATPLVVALVGAALVVGVSQLQPAANPSPGGPLPSQNPVVTPDADALVPLSQWVPTTSQVGRPAPVGTALYRTCQDTDCTVFLLGADGNTTKLRDVQPELAEQVEGLDDLTGVSLSFDAQWIGIPQGDGGYGIYSLLDSRLGAELSPTSTDGAWEMVGWGSGSLNASLVERTGDHATRYALVDVAMGLEVYKHDADDLGTLEAVGHGGDGVFVSEPVSSTSTAANRPQVTSLALDLLVLRPQTGSPVGTVIPLGEPVDVSASLSEDETLAGQNGVPQSVLAPAPPGEDFAFEIAGIYNVSEGDPALTGATIVKSIHGGSSVRFEMPESTATSMWQIMHPLTAESLALLQRTSTAARIVRLDINGSMTVLHDDLPAAAEILVPGDRWGEF